MLFHITLQLHLTCIFSSQYCALNSRRPFVFCLITGIRDIVHDAKIINCVFSEFNLHLYTSKVPLCIINKPCPMMKITFPNIYSTVASTLGEPISISEEIETIKRFQSGKSPATGGFISEFYKAFFTSLSLALQNMFIEAFFKAHFIISINIFSTERQRPLFV